MRAFFRWVAISVGFAAVGAANWYLGVTTPDISPLFGNSAAPSAENAIQSDVPDLKTASLVQAGMRPLFERNRRPWVPPPPAPDISTSPKPVPPSKTAAAPALPDAKLVGIQRSQASTMVLLLDGSGVSAEWFKVGSTYNGWLIGDVTPGSVTLESGERTFKLELYPTHATGSALP